MHFAADEVRGIKHSVPASRSVALSGNRGIFLVPLTAGNVQAAAERMVTRVPGGLLASSMSTVILVL